MPLFYKATSFPTRSAVEETSCAGQLILPWQIIVEAEFCKLHVGVVIIVPCIDDFEAEELETIWFCSIEEVLFFFETFT